jgi:hypothetical protein
VVTEDKPVELQQIARPRELLGADGRTRTTGRLSGSYDVLGEDCGVSGQYVCLEPVAILDELGERSSVLVGWILMNVYGLQTELPYGTLRPQLYQALERCERVCSTGKRDTHARHVLKQPVAVYGAQHGP